MDLGLNKRVAMIAAASKGLGKAIARSLAAEGCLVSISARDPETLRSAAGEIEHATGSKVLTVPGDVARAEDLERWYRTTRAELGAVDILITNTGGPPAGRFLTLSDEVWMKGIESTLMNVVRLCRFVIPEMQERHWGRIVHLTSLAAKQPIDLLTISSTLRAGISALTKTMANQHAADGILINAILPGHILTDRQIELNELRSKEEGISMEEYAGRVASQIPIQRLGNPEEIGSVVAFLCSQQASYLTGATLQVDGGLIRGTF